jgi:hypothetical protein
VPQTEQLPAKASENSKYDNGLSALLEPAN